MPLSPVFQSVSQSGTDENQTSETPGPLYSFSFGPLAFLTDNPGSSVPPAPAACLPCAWHIFRENSQGRPDRQNPINHLGCFQLQRTENLSKWCIKWNISYIAKILEVGRGSFETGWGMSVQPCDQGSFLHRSFYQLKNIFFCFFVCWFLFCFFFLDGSYPIIPLTSHWPRLGHMTLVNPMVAGEWDQHRPRSMPFPPGEGG